MLKLREGTNLRDPVFKGCTRPAMLFGVPLVPLAGIGLMVILISVWTTIFFSIVLGPIILVMRAIAQKDDQQFRLLSLRLLFRLFHYNRNRHFWRASVYSPLLFKRRK